MRGSVNSAPTGTSQLELTPPPLLNSALPREDGGSQPPLLPSTAPGRRLLLSQSLGGLLPDLLPRCSGLCVAVLRQPRCQVNRIGCANRKPSCFRRRVQIDRFNTPAADAPPPVSPRHTCPRLDPKDRAFSNRLEIRGHGSHRAEMPAKRISKRFQSSRSFSMQLSIFAWQACTHSLISSHRKLRDL